MQPTAHRNSRHFLIIFFSFSLSGHRNHLFCTGTSVQLRRLSTIVKAIWSSRAAKIKSQIYGSRWMANVWAPSMAIKAPFGASTAIGHRPKWSPAPVTCQPSEFNCVQPSGLQPKFIYSFRLRGFFRQIVGLRNGQVYGNHQMQIVGAYSEFQLFRKSGCLFHGRGYGTNL